MDIQKVKDIPRVITKKEPSKKDIKLVYLYSEKQGFIKGLDIIDGKIEIKDNKGSTRTFIPEDSAIYELEDYDHPKKIKHHFMFANMKSGFGVNLLAQVREGTPSPELVTHLLNKAWMKKFNDLTDIKPATSFIMNIIIGAGIMFAILFVLTKFLGVKIF